MLWQVPGTQPCCSGSQSTLFKLVSCRCQEEASNPGWQGRTRYLPQTSPAPGILTLIVKSFSHSRVVAPQSQPLRPALLLQNLPAKALEEQKKSHKAVGQSPLLSSQNLPPQDAHVLNITSAAFPHPLCIQSSPWCISQRCQFAALR